MPTYDYKCQDCEYRFEAIQSMKDDPLQECPKCHGRVKRLIGAGAGIIFKGSGFYQTDYRSEAYREAAKKEQSGDSTKSDTAKSESKDTGKSAGTTGSGTGSAATTGSTSAAKTGDN